MKISVIIPTFGNPKYLEKAMQSVFSQTVSDWELFIVDDNEPKSEARRETEKIINSYLDDVRITYIKHTSNRNGSAARNTGLALANGEFIAFLDSDDEFTPMRFEKCSRILENVNDSRIAAVYSGCEFRRNGKKYRIIKNVQHGNHLLETLACTFKLCTGSNIFIKRDVILELGGFDETFTRHQDYEFLVRYFKKYDLEAINEVLVIKNNDNINLPDPDRIYLVKKHFLEKYSKIISGLSQRSQNYIFAAHYYALSEAYLDSGDFFNAEIFRRKSRSFGGNSIKNQIRWYIKQMQKKFKGKY